MPLHVAATCRGIKDRLVPGPTRAQCSATSKSSTVLRYLPAPYSNTIVVLSQNGAARKLRAWCWSTSSMSTFSPLSGSWMKSTYLKRGGQTVTLRRSSDWMRAFEKCMMVSLESSRSAFGSAVVTMFTRSKCADASPKFALPCSNPLLASTMLCSTSAPT
eukprot:scaffold64130_cov72-Phaeocystis_antarctica.AAC.2